jgi:hypothetical protein
VPLALAAEKPLEQMGNGESLQTPTFFGPELAKTAIIGGM